MNTSKLIRWGGICAVVAGVLTIAYYWFDRAYPLAYGAKTTDYISETIFRGSIFVLIPTLLALKQLHAGRWGLVGRIGFGFVMLSAALALLMILLILGTRLVAGSNEAAVQLGRQMPTRFLHFPTVIAHLLGVLLLGIGIAWANVLPRWVGVMLILVPLSGFLNIVPGLGATIGGLIWIALGYVLLASRRASMPTETLVAQ